MRRLRIRAAATVAVLAILVATAAAGCSGSKLGEGPRPCSSGAVPGLALAIGARANSPAPVYPAVIDSDLDHVMNTKQGFTLIRVDGRPGITCAASFNTGTDRNSGAITQDKNNFKTLAVAEVTQVKAKYRESDPLTALSLAADSAGPGGTVILIDSGLQTVAPLDFRKSGLLHTDPTVIVANLRDRGLLPHLEQRHVVLAGIGYTAPPQAALDQQSRDNLVAIWMAIASASGAASVDVNSSPNTSDADSSVPTVSLVPIPALSTLQPRCNAISYLDDDGPVGFVANTTKFLNEATARAELARYADWLKTNREATVDLVGNVAHYGTNVGPGLSGARANRVADLFVELGVARSRITASGGGWGPFPNPTASHDPTDDPKNRRVVLTLRCLS